MKAIKNVFEDNFRIVTGEVEPLTVLKPSGILDCFQTVAGIHATVLGIGLKKLLKDNLAWVLMRVKYDVIKQIPKESKVIVKTWPLAVGVVDYDRDYLILDEDGNVFVKGSSKWVIIDFKDRRILRAPYNYPCECLDNRNYKSFDRIRVSFDETSNILGSYTVRNTEIDILGHLNNVRYADIVFQFYPYELKSLQIDYIRETKLGETLTIKEKIVGEYTIIGGFVEDELRFVAKFQK